MKVIVAYEHDSANLGMVELAITDERPPPDEEFQPALRDTVNGQKVVWVKTDKSPTTVYLRDGSGIKRVAPL